MDGATDQALALVIVGNAFLQGLDIGMLGPDSASMIFCREVRFAGDRGSPGIPASHDPMQWFQQLAERRAGLKLHVVPRNDPAMSDIMSSGFANGGPRLLIEALSPGEPSRCWQPRWQVTGKLDERRIWTVTYDRVGAPSSWPETRPFREIEKDLVWTLESLAAFVERAAPSEAMPGWEENFRNARAALDEPPGDEAEAWPAGFLPSEARCLLRAARAGSVFGGMGSWNDGAYWGTSLAEGDRLSEKLFVLLQEAVTAVANSSFRGS
ncbi:MAG: hypothetical protein QOJ94_2118 [Sphingomonadales bacterium]|jgi:hypothetical protein|nr:hypothetical protein [Sphingomonadales bacterium]